MLFFLTFELFIIILCSPFPATTYILIAKWWFIFLFLQHPCDYESSDSSAVAEWLPVFYTQWDLHAISSYLFTINAHLLSFLTECSHFRFSWYVLLGNPEENALYPGPVVFSPLLRFPVKTLTFWYFPYFGEGQEGCFCITIEETLDSIIC